MAPVRLYISAFSPNLAKKIGNNGYTTAPLGRAAAEEEVRCDKIDYPSTDQWGSFKAQQKLHFKAFFHAVH